MEKFYVEIVYKDGTELHKHFDNGIEAKNDVENFLYVMTCSNHGIDIESISIEIEH